VMENGLPSQAVVWIDRPDGFVYDLVSRRRLETETTGGRLAFDVHLGPCDGKLLMITPREIDGIRIDAPEETERGRTANVTIAVIGSDGRPVDAVVPLEVNIRDSQGALAEFSGYYGAAAGSLKLALDVARNDPFGVWQIEVRELASGASASRYLRVLGPEPWPPSPASDSPAAADAAQPQG